MISKNVKDVQKALEGVSDGMTLMLGGFGLSGIPENAIAELVRLNVKNLTCISNNAGVDDFEVRIEDLEDQGGDGVDDDPDTDSRGSWSEGDRVLRIDEGNLDDPTILGTVAHEVRHAEQHKAVDDLPWWWWEDFDGPPGVSQSEVEEWKYNFENPKRSQTDGFDAYADQATERDARETGGGFLDDFDEDDLERTREEAR